MFVRAIWLISLLWLSIGILMMGNFWFFWLTEPMHISRHENLIGIGFVGIYVWPAILAIALILWKSVMIIPSIQKHLAIGLCSLITVMFVLTVVVN